MRLQVSVGRPSRVVRLGLAAVFSGAGRVEPVTSGSLFGGAIRAEDIAGWGV